MSHKSSLNASALTKLQQAYWEAKRDLNNLLGKHDDECWASTDTDLDSRIQLLQEADNCYDTLLVTLLQYRSALCTIMAAEENLGSALVEYGIKDSTQAEALMKHCGRAISRSASCRAGLKSNVMELYHEVQTFQFKATVDVLQTVSKTEKVRKSYRSGLMWMKKESQNLDPDVTKKMKKFRKVQEHIKNLKTRFDAAKLDTMQKIDLYLFSRCNLFSKTLVPYREIFCEMSRNYADYTWMVPAIPYPYSVYKFETLKDLNEYSQMQRIECPQNLKQKHRSQNSAKRNLNDKKEPKNLNTQPTSTSKTSKSHITKSTISKKVKFNDPLVSQDLKGKSSTVSENLLINWNDNENHLISQTKPRVSSMSGKYSEDLLSLQWYSNVSGDTMKKSNKNTDYDKEFEECFELCNLQETADLSSEELEFWTLLESFGDCKDSNENNPKIKAPINPAKMKQENIVPQWEKVLIEFDPYNENILNNLGTKTFMEDC